jgi:hypothetical protein
MLHKAFAFTAALALSFTGSQAVVASEDALEQATVVVYRAEESVKSRRIRMDVHVDSSSAGRIKSDDSLVVAGAPGQYTLGSSITGTEPLVIDLQPGSTHYVHMDVQVRGGKALVSFNEVEEQVAKVQQPLLDAAI